ncbi:hypothetical protein ABZ705_30725 [Streptomyces sp. NPDC006984]|uniref:hypothetical protein n=1 Tax=Streptomyces sp. NPDC006984 TaxID=3155463 RepID=UPI0033FC288B
MNNNDTAGPGSAYLDGLPLKPRNLISATLALARIDELGWAPVTGYPGSDVLWTVRCLLCGWTGQRFYSHLRRARPLKRHNKCAPISEHARLLAALAASSSTSCRCRVRHPTTPADAASVIDTITSSHLRNDTTRLATGLHRLLSPCPATAARARAVSELDPSRP